MPDGQKYEEWLSTPKEQRWLKKYKIDRGKKNSSL
jgi:hypothetical protein